MKFSLSIKNGYINNKLIIDESGDSNDKCLVTCY